MADILNIVSKEQVDILYQLVKAASDLDASVTKVNKSITDNAAKAQELNTANKEAERIAKEQAAAVASLEKQRAKGLEQMAKQEAKQKELDDAILKEAKSIDELKKQNAALIKQRDQINTKTKEGKKAIEDINKTIDKNNKVIKENSSNLEQQKINVGNYISSWGPFQGIANMVTRGIGIMKIAFISLKAAIISTGIGALVVLLGSLYTYFTRTGEGADKLAIFMAKVRAVVDVLIDRFAKFGEGLVKIFTGDFKEGAQLISESFKGISKELREEVQTAGKLADEMDKLDERSRAERVQIAKNNLEKEKALEIARSETSTLEEKEAAIKRAMSLARANNAMITKFADDELRNLQETAKMRELNDDELNKLADLEIASLEKKASAQSEINSLLKLQNKIMGEVADQQERSARITDIQKMAAIEADQVITDNHIAQLELREQADIDFTAREIERLAAQKEARLQAAQDYVQAYAEIGQTLLDFNQFMIDTEVQKMEQAKAYELQLAGDNVAKREAIEKKYDQEATKLKTKQAKQDKAQALFAAIIKTAQAVLAGLAYGPPLGYVFAALNAVLGAVQIGVIASQPIPQFAKGTRKAPRGLAMVGEKGRELIFGADGSVNLSPSHASLVNLGRGGQRIIPNAETEMLLRMAKGGDSKEALALLNRVDEGNKRIVDAIKNKKELHISANGRRITEREGNYTRTYLDKKINW